MVNAWGEGGIARHCAKVRQHVWPLVYSPLGLWTNVPTPFLVQGNMGAFWYSGRSDTLETWVDFMTNILHASCTTPRLQTVLNFPSCLLISQTSKLYLKFLFQFITLLQLLFFKMMKDILSMPYSVTTSKATGNVDELWGTLCRALACICLLQTLLYSSRPAILSDSKMTYGTLAGLKELLRGKHDSWEAFVMTSRSGSPHPTASLQLPSF